MKTTTCRRGRGAARPPGGTRARTLGAVFQVRRILGARVHARGIAARLETRGGLGRARVGGRRPALRRGHEPGRIARGARRRAAFRPGDEPPPTWPNRAAEPASATPAERPPELFDELGARSEGRDERRLHVVPPGRAEGRAGRARAQCRRPRRRTDAERARRRRDGHRAARRACVRGADRVSELRRPGPSGARAPARRRRDASAGRASGSAVARRVAARSRRRSGVARGDRSDLHLRAAAALDRAGSAGRAGCGRRGRRHPRRPLRRRGRAQPPRPSRGGRAARRRPARPPRGAAARAPLDRPRRASFVPHAARRGPAAHLFRDEDAENAGGAARLRETRGLCLGADLPSADRRRRGPIRDRVRRNRRSRGAGPGTRSRRRASPAASRSCCDGSRRSRPICSSFRSPSRRERPPS